MDLNQTFIASSSNQLECKVDLCRRKIYAKNLCRSHYERNRKGGELNSLIGESVIDVWFRKIIKNTQDQSCIIWPFAMGSKGYGVWGPMPAHRRICFKCHGIPPTPKYMAAHTCGERKCVNPNHLRWTTAKENEADKILHGRDNKLIWISKEVIDAARELYNSGGVAQKEVAKKFNISKAHMNRIVKGTTRLRGF